MSDRRLLNIYTTIWCLYELQGVLGLTGIVAQFFLLFNVGLSFYYMVFNKNKWGPYMQVLTLFIIMLTVYGLLLIISHETILDKDYMTADNFSYLKNIYISLLPIFPFYYFAKKGVLTDEIIRRWVWIFLPVITVLFFYNRNVMIYEAMLEGIDMTDYTNNIGYLFLSLLPMILFFRKKLVLQYALMAYCMFFLIFGMKRGAILIGVVVILIMVIQLTRMYSGRKSILSVLLISILIVFGVYVVHYFLTTSDFFNNRLAQTMEGDSSERDELYSLFINHYLHNTTAFQFLFGSGALSTLKLGGQYAHNDWLELAINQGLLGVVMYLFYWMAAYKEWSSYNRYDTRTLVLGLVFLIYFMKSWFSMSYDGMDVCSTMVLGYCLAKHKGADLSGYR